jgi:hypothetical protein
MKKVPKNEGDFALLLIVSNDRSQGSALNGRRRGAAGASDSCLPFQLHDCDV